MNPDRGAEIGLPETVTNPQRNGHLPRWVRVPASILVFVGTSALDQMTNRAEAVDLNCRVGLGLQVEPEFYAKGARISVIESGPTRRQELLDPTRERAIDLGVAPSNTTRDGKDARVVVHFAADQQGRQLTPSREATVNCDQLEHVRYSLTKTLPSVATSQRAVTPVTSTVTSSPAKVEVTGVPTVPVAAQVDVGKVPTLRVEVEKVPSVAAKVDIQNVPPITVTASAKVEVTGVPTVPVAAQVDVGKVPTLPVDANVRITGPVQVETNPWFLFSIPLSIIGSAFGLGLLYWLINRRRGPRMADNTAHLNVPITLTVNPAELQVDLNPTLHQGPAPAQQGPQT